jgi:NitT/TauT family transport system substrate-binding protein
MRLAVAVHAGLVPILVLSLFLFLGVPGAEAQDPLTLQLKWVPQTQFAGYYAAKDKGFYTEEGLDVTIKAGGSEINPSQVIAAGGADVVVDWMASALHTRELGVPLVNIAQIFRGSSLMLLCRRDSGISGPTDFRGRTLGVWSGGNEYPFLAWMSRLGYRVDGDAPDVTLFPQGGGIDALLDNRVPCLNATTYNEYWRVVDGGLSVDRLRAFPYADQGIATLEDGLWVLAETLRDPVMVDRLARFTRATLRGWDWVASHPEEAVDVVLNHGTLGPGDWAHQSRMLREVIRLLGTADGRGILDTVAAEETVRVLMEGEGGPVLDHAPSNAWTDVVTRAAFP